MTPREKATEILGSMCFVFMIGFLFIAAYTMAPPEPGPHSEAVMGAVNE